MSQEIFDKVVHEIETVRDSRDNNLDMASIIASEGNKYYTHYFKDRDGVDIRSIAKPIVCLAMGAAIEKGLVFNGIKIDLDTHIWQFVSNYTTIQNSENIKKWKQVVLLDCFKITLGHDKGLMFSSDVKEQDENNLVNYVVNFPITREIGKSFIYSNAGTFLISTLITECLNKNLEEFVDEFIFSPMGITDYSWKKYGKYTAGCTGLKLQNEDLHKIGRLLINNGIYNKKQLVPSHWIMQMRSPQVPSPTHRYIAERAFPKWSYGLNLWICQDGNYYCDGSNGQYLIVIPEKDVVITTLGYQKDTKPVSKSLGAWK